MHFSRNSVGKHALVKFGTKLLKKKVVETLLLPCWLEVGSVHLKYTGWLEILIVVGFSMSPWHVEVSPTIVHKANIDERTWVWGEVFLTCWSLDDRVWLRGKVSLTGRTLAKVKRHQGEWFVFSMKSWWPRDVSPKGWYLRYKVVLLGRSPADRWRVSVKGLADQEKSPRNEMSSRRNKVASMRSLANLIGSHWHGVVVLEWALAETKLHWGEVLPTWEGLAKRDCLRHNILPTGESPADRWRVSAKGLSSS